MGWGKNKLKGRIEKKKEGKERTIEKQQEKMFPVKSTTRILTGDKKEVKKREGSQTEGKHIGTRKDRRRRGDKRKDNESSRGMADILRKRRRRDRRIKWKGKRKKS